MDLLQVRVKGAWQSNNPNVSGADYRAIVSAYDPRIEWLKSPSQQPNGLEIGTRSDAATTISFQIVVKDVGDSRTNISIHYLGNPTRTLAHLLRRYRGDSGCADRMSELSTWDFFSKSRDVPVGLDGADNFIADADAALLAFGDDIFTAFLPTYVAKLRALTMALLSHDPFEEVHSEEGGADVLTSDDGIVRIDWDRAQAPQMETYFERYHGSARAVVRSAAQNVLTKLDHAIVRHHLSGASFERESDLFSMRCQLPYDKTLSVYAKVGDRLRFEISRKRAGRYTDPLQPGPSGRLLSMFSSERRALLTACRWQVVGELFAEHQVPVADDLLALIEIVNRCCATVGIAAEPVLETLMIDGGLSMTSENSAVVHALAHAGLIARITLRRKDHPLPRRYSLTPRYLAAHLAVLDALSGSEGG
ncbi:MAG: hypothetical protein ABIT16_02435 [Croceibacterium sp.]